MVDMSFKIRIYPNKGQQDMIKKTIGSARFVYNRVLAHKIELYKNDKKSLPINEYIKMIPKWKSEEETKWLREVDSIALQQSLRDLDRAYKNFFRNPGKTSFPKFKSKKNDKQTYRTNNVGKCAIKVIDKKHIKLPKLGTVKARVSKNINGRVLSATIKHTLTDKYYCIFCCTNCVVNTLNKPQNSVIGVDVGVKDIATTSKGKKYHNNKYLYKTERQLKRQQRKLSRKIKGSNNRQRQKVKLARIHEKIANQRTDTLNKITTSIVRENQTIVIEDLNIKGMQKNHYLAKAISDASLSELSRQLKYKCDWYNRELVIIDKWFPSTQLCSECGYQNKYLTLAMRKWKCPKCKTHHDRDINAAVNIANEGMRVKKSTVGHTETVVLNTTNACGVNVRPETDSIAVAG